MQQNEVDIKEAVPATMINYDLVSGASNAITRRRREFTSQAQLTYQYDNNDEIEFQIGSSTDMMDLKDTYLRFELRTTGEYDTGENDFLRYLDDGGAYNLFRRIEVTDRSSRQIDSWERHDQLANILSFIYMSPDHINRNEWVSGDSQDKYPYPPRATFCPLTGTVTMGTNTVTGVGTLFTDELYPSAPVRVTDSTTGELLYEGKVLSITSDTVVTVTPAVPSPIAAASTMSTASLSNDIRVTSPANTSLTQSGIVVNMRLQLGFFKIREYLPLFLMEGLIIKFYLREPRFALNLRPAEFTPGGLTANKSVDYSIVNPRMVTWLTVPSATVKGMYQQKFAAGTLHYLFPGYYHQSRAEDGNILSEQSLNLTCPKSSLRRIFFVVQNERTRASTNSANLNTDVYTYPNKTFIDGNIINYQFRIGGYEYPPERVDTSDAAMTEAFQQLLTTFGLHNDPASEIRIDPQKWARINPNSNDGTCDQSHKVIFSVSLSTLTDDPMAGLRTKGVGTDPNIIVNLQFSGQNLVDSNPSTRYFDFYFEYAKIMTLSADGILLLD